MNKQNKNEKWLAILAKEDEDKKQRRMEFNERIEREAEKFFKKEQAMMNSLKNKRKVGRQKSRPANISA